MPKPKKRQPGCSPELAERVANLVRAGVVPLVAAQAEHVSEARFADWMAKGARNEHWRYETFRDAILKAEADCEVLLVSKIRQAASDDVWQAAAWLAERRFGDRWLRKSVFAQPEPGAPSTTGDPFADLDNVTAIRPR